MSTASSVISAADAPESENLASNTGIEIWGIKLDTPFPRWATTALVMLMLVGVQGAAVYYAVITATSPAARKAARFLFRRRRWPCTGRIFQADAPTFSFSIPAPKPGMFLPAALQTFIGPAAFIQLEGWANHPYSPRTSRRMEGSSYPRSQNRDLGTRR